VVFLVWQGCRVRASISRLRNRDLPRGVFGQTMPPQRRAIINLREAIQAREPLVVDAARINSIDNDTRRFLRLVAAWVEVHKRELGEHEERHLSSVQQSVQNSLALKADIEENRAAVEALLESKCYPS
jgi:hypothetical protein